MKQHKTQPVTLAFVPLRWPPLFSLPLAAKLFFFLEVPFLTVSTSTDLISSSKLDLMLLADDAILQLFGCSQRNAAVNAKICAVLSSPTPA
jgi:hypothetical protein